MANSRNVNKAIVGNTNRDDPVQRENFFPFGLFAQNEVQGIDFLLRFVTEFAVIANRLTTAPGAGFQRKRICAKIDLSFRGDSGAFGNGLRVVFKDVINGEAQELGPRQKIS